MQKGIFFDQTRCIGCATCVVACKDWHDIPAGRSSWIRVTENELGRFPNLSVSFLINLCYHCAEPNCVKVCPVQAIEKRSEDGIVVVDSRRCIGEDSCNGLCLKACPYRAPQFGTEPNPQMQKCDLCLDRWGTNRKPICVNSCPTRALDAGLLNELQAKYGRAKEANGFTYLPRLGPSIIFKPKCSKF